MDLNFLKDKLAVRNQSGNLRQLPGQSGLTDFVSNDYLGLARNGELGEQIRQVASGLQLSTGGTGSRLLSGNHSYYKEVEGLLRTIFHAEATLIFNSGYQANQAVVSSLAGKGDTIIYDQLSHVCLKEGAWLSKADSVAFKHNDLDDLEMRLNQATGRKFVVTETIFSMDGDFAPMEELAKMCKAYDAYLIVDEAHSTGSYGKAGSGLLRDRGLENEVLARIYTFGKSMGVHGACVAGPKLLVDYLVNFARPFIYTTSLPPHSLLSIQQSFEYLANHENLQVQLQDRIRQFRATFPASISKTAIQPVIVSSSIKAKTASDLLRQQGLDVRAILSPTVQRGKERLRISLHSFNTADEIDLLTSTLKKVI